MLRHDQARAHTATDQTLIDRMSGEFSDEEFGTRTEIAIALIMEAGQPTRGRPNGHLLPNAKRWESFGWMVTGVPEIDEDRQIDAAIQMDAAFRQSVLAKLTPDERRVLGVA
jgi:hypothetical protein